MDTSLCFPTIMAIDDIQFIISQTPLSAINHFPDNVIDHSPLTTIGDSIATDYVAQPLPTDFVPPDSSSSDSAQPDSNIIPF